MGDLSFEAMRRAMVSSQLRTTAVNDPRIVAAMGRIQRERFVPQERAALAYVDTLVPLGSGRALNTPMATGRLLTEAAPSAGDRALVIGAATGYAAALLAEILASVTALEQDPALAAACRANLAASIEVVEGPLAAGWAVGAPYDLILIDGLVEQVPAVVSGQLREGGRLAAAVMDRGVSRLAIGRRAGGFGMLFFADAEAAPLPGFAPAPAFTF